MLADIGDFHHIGIESRGFCGLAEGSLVHSGRAGPDDDARQVMFLDCIFNELLTVLGAHVLIVCRKDDARLGLNDFGHSFHVYRCRDITAAPTNKNTYSLHFI